MITYLPGFATVQNRLLWLLILFTITKVCSIATLVMLGDYRATYFSPFRRIVGVTCKVTPFFMCLAAGSLEFSYGNSIVGWLFIAGSLFIAGFAAFVVRLRSSGKFYGVADCMLRYLSPRQVKAALLALLGVLLILTLRIR